MFVGLRIKLYRHIIQSRQVSFYWLISVLQSNHRNGQKQSTSKYSDGVLPNAENLEVYREDNYNYEDDYFGDMETPRSEAMMEVEFLEAEETVGTSLGRVLGLTNLLNGG